MLGTVKWFSDTKGYGFITCDEDSMDYFAHANEFIGIPITGQRVTFELATTKNGGLTCKSVRAVTPKEEIPLKDKATALKEVIDEMMKAFKCSVPHPDVNNDCCGVTITCWHCYKRKEFEDRVKSIMERK